MTDPEVTKAIHIEGDKLGFNSKMAIDKFKLAVKSNNNFNLVELSKKYIKPEYSITLVDSDDTNIRFSIKQLVQKLVALHKTKEDEEAIEKKRELIRAKINLLKQERTNSGVRKAKQDNNVSDEILNEYTKLKKMIKIPIPEPSEILSKPDEYKPLISMVLGNSMMKQFGSSHPYVKYFKLLADKLGVTEGLGQEMQDLYSKLTPELTAKLTSDLTAKLTSDLTANLTPDLTANLTPDLTANLTSENQELYTKPNIVNIKGNKITDSDTDSETD